MKKPLIKALGVVLSAAMICGSVPASVSPAFAAEVSAETTATSEVSVIDIGNEEKESDNSSTDPDDAISVSDNAAEEETGEAAGDDETEEVDGLEDLMAIDLNTITDSQLSEKLLYADGQNVWAYLTTLSDQDLAAVLERDTCLKETTTIYTYAGTKEAESNECSTDFVSEENAGTYYDYLKDQYDRVRAAAWNASGGSIYFKFLKNGSEGTARVDCKSVYNTSNNLKADVKVNVQLAVTGAPYGFKLTHDNKVYQSDQGKSNTGDYDQLWIYFKYTKPAGYTVGGYTTNVSDLNKTVCYLRAGNATDTTYTNKDSAQSEDWVCAIVSMYDAVGSKATPRKTTPIFTIPFTPIEYYVSYNANGGSGVDSQKCTYGTTYTYAAAPKTAPHYTLNVNLNGAPGTASAISAPRAFVNWSDVNPGQQFSNLTATNGATITKVANWGNGTCILPAAPSRTGYHFGGWHTAQGVKGAGTAYTATKDETITAVWNAQGYNVKFISDGKEYGSQSFVYGTAQGLKSLADLKISKPGYTFKGWNGTYTDGQAVKDLTDISNGTVTLTAQWEAKTDTPYTVHRYVQKSLDSTDPATGYEIYTAPEGTENPILGTETKTATTDTSVTEIAVAIPGYDTPDAIGPKTIAGDGSTTFDFYYNITDTRATLTVNHYYQTEIDGDWVLFDGKFGNTTVDGFTNVFNGVIGESMTPEQLSPTVIGIYENAYKSYTLVPTETAPKTVVLTKSSEVNYYYKMVKKNTPVEYKVEHYIQKSEGGAYELFYTDVNTAELGSTVTPALNQKAIDTVNAIEGCKCEKPQLQVVTITKEGMVFSYKYACVKGTPDAANGGSDLTDAAINEIAKKLAAGLSFKMDIDGVNYEIVQNPDGTLAIKFATTTDTKVVIPDVIKIGDKIYRITEVYEKAFKDNTTLKEVTISQNVSKIGNSAFEGCTNLEKVTLKEGLITIGDKAFKGCSSLTSITMPATVQKIGNYAFENCTKLKTVKLNEGLLTIGKKAFYNCKSLKKVKIPKSVLKIGSYAFAKCAALTSITFATDSQLMSMGTGVLSNDKKLTKIKLPGKLTAVPSKAFKNDTKLASVTIGKSVTRIGAEAFNGCKKIKKVTIPTKVQTIGEKAFYNCKSLKTVSIKSKALTSVGEKAFKKCRKGLRIVVPGSKTASYKKLLNGKY